MAAYQPESYWSEVAHRIKARQEGNVIAGDDEPYYHYKRQRFLEMLQKVDFKDKKVLEVGCGPGGNLLFVDKLQPKQLVGADISKSMLELATSNLKNKSIQLCKTNGKTLPFEDDYFDIVFTATVLQHNTNEQMLKDLLAEICRVSSHQVILFEETNTQISGTELRLGRPVKYYETIVEKHGFKLAVSPEYINIQTSYLVSGTIRKIFNSSSRKEGEKPSKVATFLQKIALPITKPLDKIFTTKKDLTTMVFQRSTLLTNA